MSSEDEKSIAPGETLPALASVTALLQRHMRAGDFDAAHELLAGAHLAMVDALLTSDVSPRLLSSVSKLLASAMRHAEKAKPKGSDAPEKDYGALLDG